MFRGMPQNFPMQRSVGAPTMGGMQSIQPLQPPTPPPRQDNFMNFTRNLGGGSFNNPNFRGQPLPQYQGPQVPTAPPRAPQQGGGIVEQGGGNFRRLNPTIDPNFNKLMARRQPPQLQQPPMPPQGGGLQTRGLQNFYNQPQMPTQGSGFFNKFAEDFRQRLPMQSTPIMEPRIGGGFNLPSIETVDPAEMDENTRRRIE